MKQFFACFLYFKIQNAIKWDFLFCKQKKNIYCMNLWTIYKAIEDDYNLYDLYKCCCEYETVINNEFPTVKRSNFTGIEN